MRTLKNILLLNAVSSGVTGLGLIVLPHLFAKLFNVSAIEPFIGTGVFLMAFATLVFVESRKMNVSLLWTRFIIVMDLSWVVVSFSIVGFNVFEISTIGYLLISAVAFWVAAMAYLQHFALKKIKA